MGNRDQYLSRARAQVARFNQEQQEKRDAELDVLLEKARNQAWKLIDP